MSSIVFSQRNYSLQLVPTPFADIYPLMKNNGDAVTKCFEKVCLILLSLYILFKFLEYIRFFYKSFIAPIYIQYLEGILHTLYTYYLKIYLCTNNWPKERT